MPGVCRFSHVQVTHAMGLVLQVIAQTPDMILECAWVVQFFILPSLPPAEPRISMQSHPESSAAEHIHADICTVQALLHKRLSGQQRHAKRQQLHRGPALGLCPGDGHLGQQGQAQGNLQTTASIDACQRESQHSHKPEA